MDVGCTTALKATGPIVPGSTLIGAVVVSTRVTPELFLRTNVMFIGNVPKGKAKSKGPAPVRVDTSTPFTLTAVVSVAATPVNEIVELIGMKPAEVSTLQSNA